MIFLVYTDSAGKETSILDSDGDVIYFGDCDDLNEFINSEDKEEIHPKHRHINLRQCEPSYCHYVMDPLPEFLASKYEFGSDKICVIDSSTGEVLSKKYCIVYADERAGYFVARYGDSFLDKKNEFILYKNDNLSIIKEDPDDLFFDELDNLS